MTSLDEESNARDGIRNKLVVVGDGCCGKTCMLLRYTSDQFPETYIPTVVEASTKELQVDGQKRTLILWDTAGQEEYDRLRPLCYERTQLVLVCFAVDDRISATNVSRKWIPEVRHFCPTARVLLVGTKIDLRLDAEIKVRAAGGPTGGRSSIMTATEGARLSKDVGADMYVECSAKTGEGVDLVFEVAVRTLMETENQRNSAVGKQKNLCAAM